MSQILVTGGGGQVGSAVVRLAPRFGFSAYAPPRSVLDLNDDRSIAAAFEKDDYSAIINCAAYTAVDKAEAEPELAYRINATAPGVLAKASAERDIPLIHVSTDYVFDGTKNSPYLEQDAVNPLGVYGRTKEAGEAAVRAINPQHAIIRTAWVVSAGPANFADTMVRLAAQREQLNVVNDQIGCPTSAEHLALALLTVAKQRDDRSGTWHFVNDGEASWYDLAEYIFSVMAKRGLKTPKLTAISTKEYPTAAVRPANSRLSATAFKRDFDYMPAPWREAIDAVLLQRLVN